MVVDSHRLTMEITPFTFLHCNRRATLLDVAQVRQVSYLWAISKLLFRKPSSK